MPLVYVHRERAALRIGSKYLPAINLSPDPVTQISARYSPQRLAAFIKHQSDELLALGREDESVFCIALQRQVRLAFS